MKFIADNATYGPYLDGRVHRTGIVARSGAVYTVPSPLYEGGITPRFCGEWAYAEYTRYADGRVTHKVTSPFYNTPVPSEEEIGEARRRCQAAGWDYREHQAPVREWPV